MLRKMLLYVVCALIMLASSQTRADQFPDKNRTAFMAACLKTSKGNQVGCACFLNNIESAVSFREYVIWETAMQLKAPVDRGVSDKIVAAIAACRK